jgi:pyrimidine-nucleoside phosphorylase
MGGHGLPKAGGRMNAVEIISKKRDGSALSPEEIAWIVDGFVRDCLPDYQMGAFLMAVVLRGMDASETESLTRTMLASGETMDLSSIPGVKVDKHSTGGVGDKVSLILAPLVACAGVPVPMMAGRGLGHTGGTLDKLEAIPNFRTGLSSEDFIGQLKKIGCAIMGQTRELVPADKKMYALRDVTGTVSSIPLICASILSKKKAEGADALVLDIKTGLGAFFQSREKTLDLAESLVKLGNGLGLRTRAVLTNMDQPLGNAVGNWLEVRESVEALQGRGPADLMEVTYALGGMMLRLAGKAETVEEGEDRLRPILESGRAFERFLRMVECQGGDAGFLERPETTPYPIPSFSVTSPFSGVVRGLNALEAGLISVSLGAGRMKQDDSIHPGAGIIFRKKIGDSVERGETLAVVYTDVKDPEAVKKRLLGAYSISDSSVPRPKMIEWLMENADGSK